MIPAAKAIIDTHAPDAPALVADAALVRLVALPMGLADRAIQGRSVGARECGMCGNAGCSAHI